ncbi:MAG: mechanosensitive ion channel [Muribaculaceae bacterium]|nr:mechanosensitive ion channel [Muribaculaceae bacterium]
MIILQDLPVVPMPEDLGNSSSFWDNLKGLSVDDALSSIANGAVSFVFKLAIAIFVFYIGKYIITKLYNFVHKIMTSRHVDPSLTTFVLSLVRIVLFFILLITVVGILGIETSSFIAIFASAGVAIGMALSGTLQNFAGGVLILLLKPFKVGDFIDTSTYTGTVKAIQIFNTIINTPDNKTIIIPNGGLSTSSINNYSLESFRRVDWTVCLSYDTDIVKAKEVIHSILREDERVLTDVEGREPFVALGEMADSSINLTVRAWTESVNYWPLYFSMNERLFINLPKAGFSFPFPQLDVHFDDAANFKERALNL